MGPPAVRECGLRLPSGRTIPQPHRFSTDSPTAVPAAYHRPHEPSMANGMANSSFPGWVGSAFGSRSLTHPA